MKFTNNPNDRGGPTKGGITLGRLSKWRGQDCNAIDVELLSEDEIRAIYNHDWNEIRLGEITSQRLAEAVYHCQTTSGSGEAVVLLQRAINDILTGNNTEKIQEDRILGTHTLEVLNGLDQDALIRKYHDKRLWLIDQIILAHPEQIEFKNGWINRVEATT